MSTAVTVPTRWVELLALVPKQFPGAKEFLAESAEEIADARPRRVANALGVPADGLAEIAVMLGPAAARPLAAPFHAALPVALNALSGSVEGNIIGAMGTLSYVGFAQCCGLALPAGSDGVERAWLPTLAALRDQLTEKEAHGLAFVALASGAFEQVPAFVGGGALPDRVEPGHTFEFSVERFVRYMAAAAAQGRSAHDVRPAFEEFVQLFPFKLGANSLSWVPLLNAARAYYAHFEGRAVGTVAETLHDLVVRLAARESGDTGFVTSGGQPWAVSPALRITYAIGNEHSPVDPFGRTNLVLEGTGHARLDVRGGGRPPRAWEARVDLAALEALAQALQRAGFPAGSQRAHVAGAALAEICVEREGVRETVTIDRYEAEKLPGYREAYALLDSLAWQISGGETAPPDASAPAPAQGAITAVTRVAPR